MSNPQSPCIKPDPTLQEEQDDLLMSYLNADYVSNDSPWLDHPPSPPYSTSSDMAASALSPPALPVQDSALPEWSSVTPDAPGVHPEFLGFPFILPHLSYLPGQATTPLIYPALAPQPPSPGPSSTSSYSSSSSDSEQPKRKRGRKKRDSVSPAQPSPPPIAPAPTKPNTQQPSLAIAPVKIEQMDTPALSAQRHTPPPHHRTSPQDPEVDSQKATALAKRQERLIKNRAAALLSRKRKREHLMALEEQKDDLSRENESLKSRVMMLESQMEILQKENEELRERLNPTKPLKNAKATGMVFMMILFSFAMFSLPTQTNRLTVGGTKQLPLLSSISDAPFGIGTPTLDPPDGRSASADLVLLEPVKSRALQTWIKDRLHQASPNQEQAGLVRWSSSSSSSTPSSPASRPIYLYSHEFSQVAPVHTNTASPISDKSNQQQQQQPILSLISPYGEKKREFLQIDVQVLRSQVIDGQLLALEQCAFAESLLDDMKEDLLSPTNSTLKETKRSRKDFRRKLVGEERVRKLARVL
ncbi:hypothetical protein DFQ28_004555 [Apophysomyces sp. BC1034]|nr:hypothetical protein DFQ30_006232 [Apophysomyces sp. BC1015]KAG0177152.1 hypothetical protein DFQ29_005190 [Apophysomyces sp. BC1021]KAG0188642.1 hypothetical protein DFQ28_004555 [Apophysomyces sp. BC1034]